MYNKTFLDQLAEETEYASTHDPEPPHQKLETEPIHPTPREPISKETAFVVWLVSLVIGTGLFLSDIVIGCTLASSFQLGLVGAWFWLFDVWLIMGFIGWTIYVVYHWEGIFD